MSTSKSTYNINYIMANIRLNLYKHSLSFETALSEGILNNPGNKLSPKGYINDNPKLPKVLLINIFWEFLYTAQNAAIQYQNKTKNIRLIIKKILNLSFRDLAISEDFFNDSCLFFIFLILSISFSDKANILIIILITEDIIVE